MARVRQRFDMTKAGYTLIDVLAVAPLPIRAATGAQKFPGCVLCGWKPAQALLYPQDHPNTILVDWMANGFGSPNFRTFLGPHLDGIWEALSYPLWLKSPSRTIPWFVPSFAKTGPADVSAFGGRMRLLRVHHRHSHASVFFLQGRSQKSVTRNWTPSHRKNLVSDTCM